MQNASFLERGTVSPARDPAKTASSLKVKWNRPRGSVSCGVPQSSPFRRLGFLPQMLLLLSGEILYAAPLLPCLLFHIRPTFAEFAAGGTQGILAINPHFSCYVDESEQNIAELERHSGNQLFRGLVAISIDRQITRHTDFSSGTFRCRGVGVFQFRYLLGNLPPHVIKRIPFESGGYGFARNFLSLHKGRKACGYAVKQSLALFPRCICRIVGSFLLSKLDLLP